MMDENKSKKQVIDELAELRKRIFELEKSETTRKQVEEALRKSEEKYRFLYENSAAANMIIGTDGKIKDVNTSFAEKLGYSKEELIGNYALDFIVPEHNEKATEALEKSFKGGYTPKVDLDVYARDGSIHTIAFSLGQVVLYEEDQATGILIAGVDITERK